MAFSFTVSYFWVAIITLLFHFPSQAQVVPPPVKLNLCNPTTYAELFEEISNRVLIDKKVEPSNLTLDYIIEMWDLVTTICLLLLI